MSRPLTDTEMAELTDRLKGGDPKALAEAVRATKPARVRKVRQPVSLTPEQKHLADIKRKLANLSELHARIMEAKRYLSSLPKEQRWQDERAREIDLKMARESWDSRLDLLLEPFLHSLRLHFNDQPNP